MIKKFKLFLQFIEDLKLFKQYLELKDNFDWWFDVAESTRVYAEARALIKADEDYRLHFEEMSAIVHGYPQSYDGKEDASKISALIKAGKNLPKSGVKNV